ncbi:HlyD family secretion protein [Tengunoibacter tsumagoiensis]|uniref:AprE-like beta-barrel domain-containing protein n=1 Tax=Tengunoibacter tsumagoiensis TaxID=2014871 RepID=A0A402A3A6_9CHLR|nr:HlyD family efflux transporter periplasmic adaptor subunit [Tengunoibacter tsumagoiensis]GCE13630.1 hypothetical protein KTT_34890 [Tengunoibacter tsumagoiensis]
MLTAHRRVLIILIILPCLFITGGIWLLHPLAWANHPNKPANTVQAIGWVQSDIYNLAFENVTGNIQEIDVTQGETVHKGQVLARIDPVSLEQAVAIAQTTADAAQATLSANLLHQSDTIAAIQARVAAAQALVRATQKHVNATFTSSEANILTARVILDSDQMILQAVKKSTETEIARATAQLQRDIQVCQTTSAASIHVTVQPTSTATASSPPSPGLATCLQLARATYQHAIAVTRATLTTAQAQVQKDQQFLNATIANGNANNTGVEEQLKNAEYIQVVAATNTDRSGVFAQVVAAQGQVEIALTELEIARENLAHATLIAPHNGTVTAINGTVGGPPGVQTNLITGSTATLGVFIQLVDLTTIHQLQLHVNETDITKVKIGQAVQFTLKTYGAHLFHGTVAAISPKALYDNETNPPAITYPVIISIDPHSTQRITLLPDMSVTATIIVEP